MVTTKELCRIYAKTYGISIKYAETIVNTLFELMSQLVYIEGEDVQIRKFGTFRHKKSKPKAFKHPVTGEMGLVPEHDIIKFLPSETFLKQEVVES